MDENYCEVERFKFRDIVQHWGRERLVHDVIVSQELAKGIVREGLRFQSVDPKWTKSTEVLHGYPLIGYSAYQHTPPILIRAEVLEHLLGVERKSTDVDLSLLHSEFVTKNDFRKWLIGTGRVLPRFWFGPDEHYHQGDAIKTE